MNDIDIHSRPLLFDRIQVSVTPDFMTSKINDKLKNIKGWILFHRWFLNLRYRRFTDEHGFFRYFVYIPELKEYPFVSDIKISAFHPFTCTLKINFTRLLKYTIFDDPYFRKDYDSSIMLDDDNFLNYECWPYWDNNLVSYLKNNLKDFCLDVAKKSLKKLIGDNSLIYQNVTISQIESNTDYFVGCNNSMFIMSNIPSFLNSVDGKDFINNIKCISLKHYVPDVLDCSIKHNKNECDSIQFEISKGLFMKFYRKTKDHIRCELLFEKPYIRRKFNNGFENVLKAVENFSKSFLKKSDIESFLYNVSKCKNNLIVLNQLQPVYDFFRIYNPSYNDIINSVLNPDFPVSDTSTIKFIQKNPDIRKLFVRELGRNGWVYFYDPLKASERRIPIVELDRDFQLVGNRRKSFSWEVKNRNRERRDRIKDFQSKGFHLMKKKNPYSFIECKNI